MSSPAPPAVHLALIAVQVFFASLSIVAKRVLVEIPPFGLVAIRAAGAGALLAGFAVARDRWRVPAGDAVRLARLAILGIAANQLLFIQGLARTSATMALVLGTTIPVFTAGLAVIAGHEKASGRRIAGVGLGLAGAVVAILGSHELALGGALLGDLLIVANSLSYALYLVLARGVLRRHDPLLVTTWVLGFGAIMVVPFGAGAAIERASALSAGAWLGIAWIILAPTVAAYALNAYALARAPASLVATYIYVQPVVGAALAAVVLGERPAPATLAGAGCAARLRRTVRRARRAARSTSRHARRYGRHERDARSTSTIGSDDRPRRRAAPVRSSSPGEGTSMFGRMRIGVRALVAMAALVVVTLALGVYNVGRLRARPRSTRPSSSSTTSSMDMEDAAFEAYTDRAS